MTWFHAGKISAESKNCELSCASLKLDLGTFDCPLRCDELCHPQTDTCAELKKKISQALKKGRPSHWERNTESAKSWSNKEKDRVVQAISQLPPRLRKLESVGIYRMSKSVDKGNPASNLESTVVLYDLAFNEGPSLERILAHEFAHLYYRAISENDRNAYSIAASWVYDLNGKISRPGRKSSEYVEADGMVSPEEDFANNVEEALLNDSRLKKISPGVHHWLHNFFGDSLKLGGPCAK